MVKFGHLGKILKSLWPFLNQLFSIWQDCEPTLANIWAHFNCSKWPNIQQIIQESGHTVRVYLDKRSLEPFKGMRVGRAGRLLQNKVLF